MRKEALVDSEPAGRGVGVDLRHPGTDARRVELSSQAPCSELLEPYPDGTVISHPNQASRMLNVRLSAEQFAAIQEIAESQHLPMSTMARAWLLNRLDKELRVS